MKKVVSIISLFLLGFGIIFFCFLRKETLHEAKWNAPDTTLAITINGEISTTFPTTNAYTGTVECTSGSGKIEWKDSKWILTTSGITKGSTKCNAIFITRILTLSEAILANNVIKIPITTPGSEVSAYTLDDVGSQTTSVSSTEQTYYITYGTGWSANGTKFNLTGTTVTTDTYANSYSSLVGKYLPSNSFYYAGSSISGTMKTTTNLSSVYYVVSATSNSITYKSLASNKNVTEAVLASSEDDYGTSYYFRGAVKNNYVQFVNKCWRIVRIVGDGSVKLVLHNDNISNASSPCTSVNNSNAAAFARYSGNTYSTAFNSSYNDNAYIGFMYGTAGSSNYARTHTNTNKSTILTNLETWYTNNLASYADKLADTIWCNDKSTVSGELGYGTNATDYATFNRMTSTKQPTLKCPNDNNGGKLSKFTISDTTNGNGALTYKIGLLTIDEVAFAGYISNADNSFTYLLENARATGWWTLSPVNGSIGGSAATYVVGNTSFGYNDVNWNSGLRPAISLTSSVKVTGSGTSSDPYVVQ